MPNLKPSIPYPSRRDNERRRDQANEQIEKFYEIFKDMSFEISFTDTLILMPNFASTLKALIGNKEKLNEMARTPINEHCLAVILNKLPIKLGDPGKFLIPCEFPRMNECLAFADLGASINLMPLSVWEGLSLSKLTSNSMTLELANRSVFKPIGIAKDVSVKVGLFHFLADFVVVDFEPDPRVPLILGRCFLKTDRALIDVHKGELTLPKTVKSFVDEPPEVELKDLPPHLEYVFLEGNNKLPVIITKELGDEEKSALIKVLKSRKRAIAWKLSEIKGINREFCTHKILMEEDYKPAVQHQRRVNPKIYDVIKKEVEKLLDAGLIYPISNSPWVSPEKTTFTCPYGTFAYRRMPFGLCNAPSTFQRCMLAIFHDMVEKTMEVFMNDFSVIGNSFEKCLSRLDKMLQRCEDTNLCLNREKSHFMVKEGIVLGHKISKNGINVDKAKVDVIAKLPHPTTVKCAVLGQRHEKHFKAIHYANKMITDAESNYTTTENIVHTDHSALKYLFAKKDPKARLLQWVLLLQEFDFNVLDTKGAENLAADHLSRLENPYENMLDINETFPLETLSMVTFHCDSSALWFVDFANYHAGNFIVKGMSSQ
nr:DNA-directed DNA polymerase [Tanacetum cinerariifolium]